MRYLKTLTYDQQNELESEVSNVEIKRAVWDCGTDKSPDPDRVTFGFYSRFWKIIENDVYDAVKYFFTYGNIPKGCNSYFIALIPKIPDANMKWDLESSGDFSVASIRKIIDDKSLSDVDSKTRWIKYVPIKVNVHSWKVKKDSLPTRFNVSRRGIDIDSIMCAICDNGVETSRHLFFYCCMARQIVRKITRWWDVSYVEVESYEDWYRCNASFSRKIDEDNGEPLNGNLDGLHVDRSLEHKNDPWRVLMRA
ncbi:RNA-directed DNA polymerase, eukaryota [Tanacetum coccineum]|uniref:RNA-directed DNA polymerase, eukaryota n=1 Tax=Tanacetum coccineum TaxID=301880 RepID=A0ABQ5APD4_9ASTR